MSRLPDDVLKARIDVITGYSDGLLGRFARWDAVEPHHHEQDGRLLLEAITQVLPEDYCMTLVMFVSSNLGVELRTGARALGISVARPSAFDPQPKAKAERAHRRLTKGAGA